MTATVSVDELKNLLNAIVESDGFVRIRYRPVDHVWHPNFLQVVHITAGRSVLFEDKARNEFIPLPDLAAIIQFEVDGYLHPFEPRIHYQILFPEKSGSE